MQKVIVILSVSILLFATFSDVFAQNNDLIVTKKGDSIACKIDTVTSTTIHFKMKSNDIWVKTTIDKNGVSDYQYNVIDKKKFNYYPGTSIVMSPKIETVRTRSSIEGFPRNIICMEYGLAFWVDIYYERIIPAGNNIGLTARIGPSIGAGFVGGTALHGGPGIVFGKKRSLGYIAGGIRHEFGKEEFRDTPYTQPYFEAFYRFVGYNGFVFQIGVETIIISAGIGYSF